MSDMPSHVTIKEVGPREGFQFEKADIGLAAKISLVDALSDTGVSTIEFTSFVSPKWVPQMADAEQMVAGIKRVPDVAYEAIWLNEAGLERAARLRESLALRPMFGVAATDTFTRKNTNRSVDEKIAELPGWARRYQALGMDWIDVGVMAALEAKAVNAPDPLDSRAVASSMPPMLVSDLRNARFGQRARAAR